MSTEEFTYTLVNKLTDNRAISVPGIKESVKSTSFVQTSGVKPSITGLSIATAAGKFQMSLDSGAMLVKSLKDGEVKTINIEPGTVLNSAKLIDFEIRDARVQPTRNFTKADPGVVNIFAHKGPDESSNGMGLR
jgi:hypothetical protein